MKHRIENNFQFGFLLLFNPYEGPETEVLDYITTFLRDKLSNMPLKN